MHLTSLVRTLGLGSRTVANRSRGDRPVARLEVESLEQRCVPATLVRPIGDFVSAQGTYLVDDTPDTPGGLFVPPAPNYLGWTDPTRGLGASIDFAGLANQTIEDLSGGTISLGTTVSGKVVERSLADGRTEVHVLLHTRNALTWAFEFDPDVANSFKDQPLLIGARVNDVLDGATPTLGQSFFQIKFIHAEPLGGQLPDLTQLAFAPEDGQQWLSMSFTATAKGKLNDGTSGRIQVTQVGLFNTGGGGATADGFPAEHILIRQTGGGNGNNGNNGNAGQNQQQRAWLAAVDALFAATTTKKHQQALDTLLSLGT